MRDIDSEELISELQAKAYDLEQQNKKLKENVFFINFKTKQKFFKSFI